MIDSGLFCSNCSTALVIHTFNVKYCSVLTQYHKIDRLIEMNFLSKKNIPRSFFLCNYMLSKTSDKLSVNIEQVYFFGH